MKLPYPTCKVCNIKLDPKDRDGFCSLECWEEHRDPGLDQYTEECIERAGFEKEIPDSCYSNEDIKNAEETYFKNLHR